MISLIFLGVLLFSMTAAARDLEFSGDVLSGESIDIDEFTFIITMNKYGSAIFVDADPMFQTVQLYGREQMGHFDIHFINTTYNEEDNELYAQIEIYRYEPDVSIARTIKRVKSGLRGEKIWEPNPKTGLKIRSQAMPKAIGEYIIQGIDAKIRIIFLPTFFRLPAPNARNKVGSSITPIRIINNKSVKFND